MRILYIIAVVLIILWAIGFAFSFLGSIIHFLLVLAVALILLNIIRGPRRRV